MKQSLKKLFVLMLIVALLPLSFVGKTKAMTASITASPNTAGATATYAITLNLSYPIPAGGYINVLFYPSFYVPATISPASIQVTGAQ
ncbi:MAG: hypothetical protein ACP5QX_01890, partial [Caldisericaceae bacterium]